MKITSHESPHSKPFVPYVITIHVETIKDEHVLRGLFARNRVVPEAIDRDGTSFKAWGVTGEQIAELMDRVLGTINNRPQHRA